MSKLVVKTDKAPAAIGPYSQAIKTDSLIFVSGQIPIIPDSGELVTGDIQKETFQALTNLKEILIAAGSDLDQVLKVTLFITDMKDFSLINEIYAQFFNQNPPARACIAVAALPKNARIEVEAIAKVTDFNYGK